MCDVTACEQQVMQWLQHIVVDLNLCPFAHHVLQSGQVRFVTLTAKKTKDILQALEAEYHYLDQHSESETSILILTHALKNFDHYLDCLDRAIEQMDRQGYTGIYQIASFHPYYCFSDTDYDDPANYTNRSPYPLFHILRETSVDRAVNSYPQIERIPENNMRLMRDLGQDKIEKLLRGVSET